MIAIAKPTALCSMYIVYIKKNAIKFIIMEKETSLKQF